MPDLRFDDGGPLLCDAGRFNEGVLLPRPGHELEADGEAVFGVPSGHADGGDATQIGRKRKAHHLECAAEITLAVG